MQTRIYLIENICNRIYRCCTFTSSNKQIEAMKTNTEIKSILDASRKYNIWSHPAHKTVGDNCCEYCGKKHGKNPLYVHVTWRGTCVPNDVTEEELSAFGEDSQGCFPIGSTCASKMFGTEINNYTKQS